MARYQYPSISDPAAWDRHKRKYASEKTGAMSPMPDIRTIGKHLGRALSPSAMAKSPGELRSPYRPMIGGSYGFRQQYPNLGIPQGGVIPPSMRPRGSVRTPFYDSTAEKFGIGGRLRTLGSKLTAAGGPTRTPFYDASAPKIGLGQRARTMGEHLRPRPAGIGGPTLEYDVGADLRQYAGPAIRRGAAALGEKARAAMGYVEKGVATGRAYNRERRAGLKEYPSARAYLEDKGLMQPRPGASGTWAAEQPGARAAADFGNRITKAAGAGTKKTTKEPQIHTMIQGNFATYQNFDTGDGRRFLTPEGARTGKGPWVFEYKDKLYVMGMGEQEAERTRAHELTKLGIQQAGLKTREEIAARSREEVAKLKGGNIFDAYQNFLKNQRLEAEGETGEGMSPRELQEYLERLQEEEEERRRSE